MIVGAISHHAQYFKKKMLTLTNYFLALTCFHLMLNENPANNHKNV